MSGRYIIVFKDKATPAQIEQYIDRLEGNGGRILTRYDELFKGISAAVPDNLIQSFGTDNLVDYFEPDSVVTIQR